VNPVEMIIEKVNRITDVLHSINESYEEAEKIAKKVSKYIMENIKERPERLRSFILSIETEPMEVRVPHIRWKGGFTIDEEKFNLLEYEFTSDGSLEINFKWKNKNGWTNDIFHINLANLDASKILFIFYNREVVSKVLDLLEAELEGRDRILKKAVKKIAEKVAEILV